MAVPILNEQLRNVCPKEERRGVGSSQTGMRQKVVKLCSLTTARGSTERFCHIVRHKGDGVVGRYMLETVGDGMISRKIQRKLRPRNRDGAILRDLSTGRHRHRPKPLLRIGNAADVPDPRGLLRSEIFPGETELSHPRAVPDDLRESLERPDVRRQAEPGLPDAEPSRGGAETDVGAARQVDPGTDARAADGRDDRDRTFLERRERPLHLEDFRTEGHGPSRRVTLLVAVRRRSDQPERRIRHVDPAAEGLPVPDEEDATATVARAAEFAERIPDLAPHLRVQGVAFPWSI